MRSSFIDPYVAIIALFLLLGVALALAGIVLLTMTTVYTVIFTTVPPWLNGATISCIVGIALLLLGYLLSRRVVRR